MRARGTARRNCAASLTGVALLATMVVSLPGIAAAAPGPAGTLVTLSGVYREVHGESRTLDQTMTFLETPGHDYELATVGEPGVGSGATVTVQGVLTGNTIALPSASSMTVDGPPPAPSAGASGAKSVLVINVVWPGASLTASGAQEQRFMFGDDPRSLASYYAAVSYGHLTWTGATTPRYTVANPGGCDLSNLALEAETAAKAGGYDPSSYDALMINAPNLYCGAAGYGEIGGNHTWIQNGLWNLDDGYARYVPTHEIGHSLGLYHSHGLECGTVTVSAACLGDPGSHNSEYGNAWDVMGSNWPGDGSDSVAWLSAKQETLLGWLSGQSVRSVTTSDTYSLAPLEKASPSRPQVLVIETPAHTYYVEYRQPIGPDAFMSDYPAATNGVHVNVGAAFGGDTGPFALDYTPQSNTVADGFDWYDAPLGVGRSFTDPEHTFTISPVSQDGTAVTVDISFTEPTTRQDSDAAFGGWATSSDSDGAYRTSMAPGSTVTFGFSGTSVAWLTKKGPAQGKATVLIDGVAKGTFDTYAASWRSADVSFTGLRPGPHLMAVRVAGTKNHSSTNGSVAVDGFVSGGITKQENSVKTTYDVWRGVGSSAASGSSYRASRTAGSTATLRFTGIGVDWLTATGPGFGKAKVYIDGVDKGTVDLYATAARYQTVKSYRGLSAGSHSIKVKVLGTKNPAATSTDVSVDAFVVH